MSDKLSILVVIYNQVLDKTPLFSFAGALKDDEIIFLDNSVNTEVLNQNKTLSSHLSSNVIYNIDGGNIGLSKAYNLGVRLAHFDWVVLFDQDTSIPENFFSELKDVISHSSSALFAPLIIDDTTNAVFSPSYVSGFRRKNFVIGAPKKTKKWSLIPVNSGSCFSKKLYQSVGGFDERLFIDFIDYSFFKSAVKTGYQMALLPQIQLRQKFSGTERGLSIASAQRRLHLFLQDAKVYYGKSLAGLFARNFVVFKHRLSLLKKYHSFRFLWIR